MRPVWFVAGVAAGVYAVIRTRRAVEAFTPEGWHDRAAGLQVGWQMFADEVRTGMAEKETELRERLLVGPDGARQLPAARDTRGDDPDGLTRDPTTLS